MKTKLTQARYKARKRSSCPMCKPYKNKWEDKKDINRLRAAQGHEQQLQEL